MSTKYTNKKYPEKWMPVVTPHGNGTVAEVNYKDETVRVNLDNDSGFQFGTYNWEDIRIIQCKSNRDFNRVGHNTKKSFPKTTLVENDKVLLYDKYKGFYSRTGTVMKIDNSNEFTAHRVLVQIDNDDSAYGLLWMSIDNLKHYDMETPTLQNIIALYEAGEVDIAESLWEGLSFIESSKFMLNTWSKDMLKQLYSKDGCWQMHAKKLFYYISQIISEYHIARMSIVKAGLITI